MRIKRLAVVTTHPVQYYAPVFALMHKRGFIDVRVFYTWSQASLTKHDPGFGKAVSWDLPLLDGYPYEWVENIASQPGSHHFKGIVNPSLIDRINDFKPDAVMFFGWAYQSHLKAMRYFKGKVTVYFRGDSTLLDKPTFFRKIMRYTLLRWVYHFVDGAFYVGTNNKAYFKQFGLKEKQLSFTPHAIDNKRFSAERGREVLILREKLGIAANDILIIFAGKFEEKKAPDLLLEVFLKIKQPGMHLLMVGNGKTEQKLKRIAEGFDYVHFMPFQNQSYMPVVYQAGDLFCLPSKGPGETWGLAINEAMACGKAILASDMVGCATDLVISAQNGYIFKSQDRDDLKKKLLSLVKDKSRLTEFGKQSQLIIQNWNFLDIVKSIENKFLYEKITDLNRVMIVKE